MGKTAGQRTDTPQVKRRKKVKIVRRVEPPKREYLVVKGRPPIDRDPWQFA